ncbi:MAG: sulfoxide reductase heme-binding subunit YedZ [Pseudohongiellaceae bacterium]|jgi:sulfoxide reductase heme-binding subunit YedZ
MTVSYQAVGWNRQKKIYDRILLLSVLGYLALFIGVSIAVHPDATAEALLIRGFGTGALLLLHIILCIGPLCRLDRRFLPLLYNRRHMGVTMFGMAFIHGAFSLIQFHALGDTNPLVSLLEANTRFDSLAQFPFQPLGAAALAILFLMAATSHDFWMANLSAPVWKALHMLVYVAYALVVMHVVLGALQSETAVLPAALLGLGVVVVAGLHLVAGTRERKADRGTLPAAATTAHSQMIDACAVSDIPEGRAKVVTVAGDRVAIYRNKNELSALSAICQHQNGPLGEGQIIDGLVTCPWHGYQYKPSCGRSPEPFTEQVPTFRLALDGERVLIHPTPLPAGTETQPVQLKGVS